MNKINMNKNKIKTTARRTAALLAALTIAPPLMGAVVQNTSTVSWGTSTAQAQPRWGDPDWAKNRNSRRATHYRDNDLSRLSWITVRGEVTDDPERDYFEFRSDSGDRYRVLARADVSLRGIDDDDRVEVYGKRDGDILVAYRVQKLNDNNGGGRDDNRFRATVADNLPGNRFTIRHRNRTTTVIAERGEPYGLRAGSEVTLEGIWRGDTFYASSVRLRDNDWDDNWQDGQSRRLRGTAVTNLNNRRFTLRTRNNQTVEISTQGSSQFSFNRGDELELTGRWDRNSNKFEVSSGRVLSNNGWDDNWQDGQSRRLRGTAVTSLNNRRFTLRTRNNQTVEISTQGSSQFSFNRGDELELTGRWDRNSNKFEVSSGRVLSNNGWDNDDDNFRNGQRVDFKGQVTKAGKMFNTWFYTVRTRRGRDVTVRYNREFRVGDRVEVEGTVRDNVVIATNMDRDD